MFKLGNPKKFQQKFMKSTKFLKNIKSIKFKRNNVIIILSLIILINFGLVSCNGTSRDEENDPTAQISAQCMQNCPEQVSFGIRNLEN